MINDQRIQNLVQTYIRAKKNGELEEDADYNELMEKYRKWQLANILDLDKLKSYSDAKFAEVFGEMFDYSDGTATSHARNRGMHFKTDESRLAVRAAFENMISFINNAGDNHFGLVEEILKPSSPLKVPGIGKHMVSTLINAKYPEVPPINNTTKEFFKNIGEPLPTSDIPDADTERTVSQFFNDVIELSHGELNMGDANHIFWYTKNIDSGRKFMEQNYAVTFEAKIIRRGAKAHKKVLTREEEVEEIYAHLKAIQDQARREK